MVRYGRYLVFNFVKRWSVYLVLVVFMIAALALSIIQIKNTNDSGLVAITNVSTFEKFFPFLFGTLFAVVVVLHVFKTGEQDGSELLIVSKPFARWEIILTKFLVTIMFIFLFQIFTFVVYIIAGSQDKFATSSQVLAYASSYGVGGFFVMIIVTSLLIIFAAVLSRVGLSVVAVLFAAILPILSFTLVPLGKGWGNDLYAQSTLSSYVQDFDPTKSKLEDVVDRDAPLIIPNNQTTVAVDKIYDEFKSGWYGGASYLDIWYQWGRFYSLFNDSNYKPVSITNYDKINEQVQTSGNLVVETSKGNYVQIVSLNNLRPTNDIPGWDKDRNYLGDFITYMKANLTKALPMLGDASLSLTTKLAILAAYFEEFALNSQVSDWNPQINSDYYFMLNGKLRAYYPAIVWKQLVSVDASIKQVADEPLNASPMATFGLRRSDVSIYRFAPTPWISNVGVIVFWIIVAMGALGGAGFVYSRRDFK